MQTERSLSHSQASVTCPYSELQNIRPSPTPCEMVLFQCTFLRCGIVSTSPNPQAGGPLLVRCPLLFIPVFCRPKWRQFPQRSFTHIKQHKIYHSVYFKLCIFRYIPNYTAPYFLKTWLWSMSYFRVRFLDSHVKIPTDLYVSSFMTPSVYYPIYF
jgi:hypothetical protein